MSSGSGGGAPAGRAAPELLRRDEVAWAAACLLAAPAAAHLGPAPAGRVALAACSALEAALAPLLALEGAGGEEGEEAAAALASAAAAAAGPGELPGDLLSPPGGFLPLAEKLSAESSDRSLQSGHSHSSRGLAVAAAVEKLSLSLHSAAPGLPSSSLVGAAAAVVARAAAAACAAGAAGAAGSAGTESLGPSGPLGPVGQPHEGAGRGGAGSGSPTKRTAALERARARNAAVERAAEGLLSMAEGCVAALLELGLGGCYRLHSPLFVEAAAVVVQTKHSPTAASGAAGAGARWVLPPPLAPFFLWCCCCCYAIPRQPVAAAGAGAWWAPPASLLPPLAARKLYSLQRLSSIAAVCPLACACCAA